MGFTTYTGSETVLNIVGTKIKTMLEELYTLYNTLNAGTAQFTTEAKTADYTVLAADLTGLKTFTNYGATANIELTLPAGVEGYTLDITILAAYYIKLTADGTEKFRYGSVQGAAGGYIRDDEVGNTFKIKFLGGQWVVMNLTGILNYDE